MICAGSHRFEVCSNKNDQDRKCANCGGHHTASYGGCPFMQRERNIQQVRVKENLSYKEALMKEKQCRQEVQIMNTNRLNYPEVHNNSKTNNLNAERRDMTDVLSHASSSSSSATEVKKVEVGIQTDRDASTETVIEESIIANVEKTLIRQLSENFITEQLAACLVEIFTAIGKADTLKKKCTVVTNAFDTHYSKKISPNILHDEVSKTIHIDEKTETRASTKRDSSKRYGK